MQTATWLVSRTLTDAAGPWNSELTLDDDGEYFARVLLASEGTHFLGEARVFYRSTASDRVSVMGRSGRKQDSLFLSMCLQIRYLRSLDDGAATRAACVRYLQRFLFDFHPERPDIVSRMQTLAAELGGHLDYPRSSAKYAWIEKCFGWNAAKKAQIAAPQLRAGVIRSWDCLMYQLESANKCE